MLLVPGGGRPPLHIPFTGPALRAGHRVAATDLPGHGDSDITFASHGDTDPAGDIFALIEKFGVPAVVGDSMGGCLVKPCTPRI